MKVVKIIIAIVVAPMVVSTVSEAPSAAACSLGVDC